MKTEAGIEPTCLLVTPGRLRDAKSKLKPPEAGRLNSPTRVERGGRLGGRAIIFDACDFPPFAYSKDTTTRVARSIGLQRRIRTGYSLFSRQRLYRMS